MVSLFNVHPHETQKVVPKSMKLNCSKNAWIFSDKRIGIILLFLVLLFICLSCVNILTSSDITVVSYNFGKGGTINLPRGRDNSVKVRLDKLISRLDDLHDFVIGLQEVDNCTRRSLGSNEVGYLANGLSKKISQVNASYFAKRYIPAARGCEKGSVGIAVLTYGAILEIASPIKNVRGGSNVLAIKIKIDKKVLWYMSVHLDRKRSDATRDISNLVNWIKKNIKENTPVIVAGDFNILKNGYHTKHGYSKKEESFYYQVNQSLIEGGFMDVSGNILTFKSWRPYSHIDYIYVKQCSRKNIKRLFNENNGLSDHVGLISQLKCHSF